MIEVFFDGAAAQFQLFRDGFVPQSFGGQTENLCFSDRKLVLPVLPLGLFGPQADYLDGYFRVQHH